MSMCRRSRTSPSATSARRSDLRESDAAHRPGGSLRGRGIECDLLQHGARQVERVRAGAVGNASVNVRPDVGGSVSPIGQIHNTPARNRPDAVTAKLRCRRRAAESRGVTLECRQRSKASNPRRQRHRNEQHPTTRSRAPASSTSFRGSQPGTRVAKRRPLRAPRELLLLTYHYIEPTL